MRLVYAALAAVALTWSPLFVVGALDPTANPIGLGLLSLAGTTLAVLLLLAAALGAIWRRLSQS